MIWPLVLMELVLGAFMMRLAYESSNPMLFMLLVGFPVCVLPISIWLIRYERARQQRHADEMRARLLAQALFDERDRRMH